MFTCRQGSIRYGNLVPFALPSGGTIVLDTGPAVGGPDCRHDVRIPEGGFRFPTFDIPALNYCAQMIDRFCERGGAWGTGAEWDGAGTPGAAMTNVTTAGDTSDGVCNPAGEPCTTTPGGAGANTLGKVTKTAGLAPGGGVRTAFGIPFRSLVWADSVCSPTTTAGCCATSTYGDDTAANGEVLIYQADSILTLTTNVATGTFADVNGDGCARAGNGFGPPAVNGPTSLTGVPAEGPCCVPGQRTTLVAENIELSGNPPLFDVGSRLTIPLVVRTCGRPVGSETCTLTTDPCRQ